MADPISLWPVVVGGLLTLAGGAVGSGVTVALKLVESRDAKKKKRADKFEELVEAVYAFDHWLNTKQNITIFGEEGKLGISPIAKIEAISAVYFPQFSKAISELVSTTYAYQAWMFEAGQKRLAGDIEHINDGLHSAYDPYAQKRSDLLDALKKFAHEEFQ
jgi:hypothetical protein